MSSAGTIILKGFIKCILLAAPVLMILSCRENNTDSGIVKERTTLSTSGGMADYLERMPAVRSVENWDNEYSTGVIIYTEHYKVYTTLMDPLMLRQVPAFVEAAYDNFQKQLPEKIDVRTEFIIYLFNNRNQWENYTRKFTGSNAPLYLKIKKGAYYLNGACVAYNIGRKTTFGVLAHEAWHQFNSRLFAYRLPSWLDEGIATTFETPVYRNGRFVFDPGVNLNRLGGLRKTIIDKKMIPLKHLIALNPGYVINDSANVTAFYSQAYALVRFLREENYGIRLDEYQNLLMGGFEGSWPLEKDNRQIAANRNIPLTAGFNAYVSTKLFSMYIGEDIEQIQEEYLRFCRKLIFHVRLAK